MAASPEFIQVLEERAGLPKAQVDRVRAALDAGLKPSEQLLRDAGIDASVASTIFAEVEARNRTPSSRPRHGDSRPSGSSRGPTSRPSSVPRPSGPARGEPTVDQLIGRLMDITPRFELQGEIARGAMGRILAGWDLHLGRAVAIKMLRKTAARDLDKVRFLEEAQVTGQLAHPSIMPVYELGRLRGQMAFVMKRVEGQSLKAVIAALRRGEPATVRDFGRMRLLNIFRQLCMAVAFAHTRGVVHRDLKPSNVMVGDFGEVVLIDWGLCKIIAEGTRSTRSTSERWQTVHGQIIGTPAYMAPEQAMGLIDQVDARTDVYGLGAILYHLLALKPPFSGKTNREIVQRVLRETVKPLRERAPDRDIEPALEAICMRCLSREAADRFENAQVLAEEIGAWLDAPKGTLTHANTSTHLAAGMSAIGRQQTLLEDLALAQDTVQTEAARVSATAPAGQKRVLWVAEERLRSLHTEYADAFASAVGALTRALAVDAENDDARRLLCELYLGRYEAAHARRDLGRCAFYRRMLASYDRGQHEMLLAGVGGVHLDISPRGSRVQVIRLVEAERRLVPGPVLEEGAAPLAVERAPSGTYLVRVEAPGYTTLVTPLPVRAGRSTRMRLRLLKQGAVPEGFVHIPAGTFRSGSPRGEHAAPGEHALPDYFISQTPITVGAYLEFLEALSARDRSEAERRTPRGPDGQTTAWAWGASGPILPEGRPGWRLDLPVVGVHLDDARAYCRWRSLQDGAVVRLPFEEEWEKAARGTEGRTYSWGWDWEPAYAAGPEAWRGPLPPRVGWAEADRSGYGVWDLVGGVREWTGTIEPGAEGRSVARGGSFLTGGVQGRPLWRREVVHAEATALDLGFRVVREL